LVIALFLDAFSHYHLHQCPCASRITPFLRRHLFKHKSYIFSIAVGLLYTKSNTSFGSALYRPDPAGIFREDDGVSISFAAEFWHEGKVLQYPISSTGISPMEAGDWVAKAHLHFFHRQNNHRSLCTIYHSQDPMNIRNV